jgi:predicted NBD/HSP70 family sugar kinase
MLESAAIRGAGGNAGEWGHTIAVPGGHPCICGKRGCLETYVSIDSLLRFLAAHKVEIRDLRELQGQHWADHPLVLTWINEGLEPLRTGLNTLENLFDPEMIMIGGDAPDWMIQAFIERVPPLYTSISRTERDLPRLMKAELGANAVARGAATLPLLAMLNPQFQQHALSA